MRIARAFGLLMVLGVGAAACSSSSSGGARPQAARTPSPAACPSPSTPGARFPSGRAAKVPHPSFAQAPTVLPVGARDEQQIRFTTQMSLRDAAVFVQKHYPAAGYRLDGGDAEAHEADILWVHGSYHGKTRLSGVTACSTTWTVAALPRGVDTSGADGH